MFRFFENIPDEITLNIIKLNSRSDQAKLARTCVRFKNLLDSNSLKLSKYKCNLACRIGEVTVVLKQCDYPFFSKLWLTHKNNNKPYSPLSIQPDDAEKIGLAIKNGGATLLKTLREMNLTTFTHDIEIINAQYKEIQFSLKK